MAERPEEGIAGLCDSCNWTPAAVRVTVSENGRRRTIKEQKTARAARAPAGAGGKAADRGAEAEGGRAT